MHPSKPTHKLGVVAISYNEEEDLPGFIGHLLSWIDEIVIVDNYSSDKTREIALAAGIKIKFISHKQSIEGGYSEQRNVGIAHSEAEWLLHMDIDERVTPELANEIRHIIHNTDLNGFCYHRNNFFMHRPMKAGGWNSWNKPQLAKRGHHHFVNNIHEECIIKGGAEKTGQLKSKMWHLNDASYKERLRKSFNYAGIDAEKIYGSGIKVTALDFLFRPALEFLKKYLYKKGFVDGIPGLIAAIHSADAVFRTYAIVWDLQHKINRTNLEDQIAAQWKQHPISKNE